MVERTGSVSTQNSCLPYWIFNNTIPPYHETVIITSISFEPLARPSSNRGGLLFGLTKGTTSQINAISDMEEGQLIYNSDTHQVMLYDGTQWVNTANSNWLNSGNTVSTGDFLGSTNDVAMDIRSNAISILQFGRRQTLGLTQNFTDYDDDDQYLTHLKGSNGTAALQFQADAADFYKPMFFTNSEGNFRLKGSAAKTDFFEIGSQGTANDGELEFIVGDDGAEPFTFKRYDYRDGLKKELMRIQGAENSQNALPRVGVGTGSLANSTLEINGSLAADIETTNTNITLGEEHHTLVVRGNNSVRLPPANTCAGRFYIIKNMHSDAITISSHIGTDGNPRTTLEAESILKLQSDGDLWQAISSNNPRPKYMQTFSGRGYYFYNRWYSLHDYYSTGYYHWNQYKGNGTLPAYNTSGQGASP